LVKVNNEKQEVHQSNNAATQEAWKAVDNSRAQTDKENKGIWSG